MGDGKDRRRARSSTSTSRSRARRRAEEGDDRQVLVDIATGKPFPKTVKFRFTGSVMVQPDPNKQDKIYGADDSGTLIVDLPGHRPDGAADEPDDEVREVHEAGDEHEGAAQGRHAGEADLFKRWGSDDASFSSR